MFNSLYNHLASALFNLGQHAEMMSECESKDLILETCEHISEMLDAMEPYDIVASDQLNPHVFLFPSMPIFRHVFLSAIPSQRLSPPGSAAAHRCSMQIEDPSGLSNLQPAELAVFEGMTEEEVSKACIPEPVLVRPCPLQSTELFHMCCSPTLLPSLHAAKLRFQSGCPAPSSFTHSLTAIPSKMSSAQRLPAARRPCSEPDRFTNVHYRIFYFGLELQLRGMRFTAAASGAFCPISEGSARG